MLVVKRQPGEEVHLIDKTTGKISRVKVLSVVFGPNSRPIVRLGIDADEDISILREELTRKNDEKRVMSNGDTSD